MMESIVDEQIIAKNVTDELFPSARVFPDVPFDSESSKENQSKVPLLSTYLNVKTFEKNKRTGMVTPTIGTS